MQTLIDVLGLGILGLDPIAAIIVASAIAAGVKEYKIFLFAISSLICTVTLGVTLSLLGQKATSNHHLVIPDSTSPLWATLSVLIATTIIIWLIIRFTKRNRPRKKRKQPKQLGGRLWQPLLVGLIFSLSSLSDPAFYAIVVVATETHNIFATIGLHTLWVFVAQLPLIALVAAFHFNFHNKLLRVSDKLWHTHRRKMNTALYVTAIILVLLLLTDTLAYLLVGRYLF